MTLTEERLIFFLFLHTNAAHLALASRGTRTLSRGLLEQSPGEPSKERRARCGRLRRTAKDTLNRARGRRKARLSARLSDQSSIAVYLRRAGGAAAARHCAQTRRRRREPDLSRRVSPARQSGKDRWRLAIGACCARLTAVARVWWNAAVLHSLSSEYYTTRARRTQRTTHPAGLSGAQGSSPKARAEKTLWNSLEPRFLWPDPPGRRLGTGSAGRRR